MTDGRVPIFDFPVLSDDREYVRGNLDAPVAGERIVSNERVWRFIDWGDRTELLGNVTIEEVPTGRPNRVKFEATFDLTGHETIVVKGYIPWDDGPWVGRERGGGTGGGRTQPVDLEGRNPKKWG